MDGQRDIFNIRPHLQGQCCFGDQLTRIRSDHRSADDLVVLIKQDLGHAFIATE